MADDVVLNKAAIVERCLMRIREVHAGDDENLLGDFESFSSHLLREGA